MVSYALVAVLLAYGAYHGWRLFGKHVIHFANLVWVRIAILGNACTGRAFFREVFGDTHDFRGGRHAEAERLIQRFLWSDEVKSFVREHEGERHQHLVLLVNAVGRDHLIDLTDRSCWIRVGHGLKQKSIADALYDFYKHDRGYDPLIYARMAVSRAKRMIARHLPSAHPHPYTSH